MKIDPGVDPNIYGSINGFDIKRTNNSLLMMSNYNSGSSKDIWIAAGVNQLSPSFISVGGQVGLTHQNFETTAQTFQSLVGNLIYDIMDSNANLNLIGRGSIHAYGPVCLDSGDPNVIGTNPDSGLLYSRRSILSIIAGINDIRAGNPLRNAEDVIAIVANGTSVDYAFTHGNFSSSSQLNLIAGSGGINVYGNIVPMIDTNTSSNNNSIGSPTNKFTNIYAANFQVGASTYGISRGFTIGTISNEPSSSTYGITRGNLNTTDSIYIGQNLSTLGIDYGFFYDLQANNLNVANTLIAVNGQFSNITANNINNFGYWTQCTITTDSTGALQIINGPSSLSTVGFCKVTRIGNTVMMDIFITPVFAGSAYYIEILINPSNFPSNIVINPPHYQGIHVGHGFGSSDAGSTIFYARSYYNSSVVSNTIRLYPNNNAELSSLSTLSDGNSLTTFQATLIYEMTS